ncbi:glycoside hydrolase family 13 protein [Laetiporus sulphureus 93-53]|uniref:alpha-amylase n=1 Tax=Laetiporus sulphureus 93-53 TaxID=1314785 RepID=A0A165CW82_9APHY|nr:glycoside hydrolase family 13 protein [Laetiporus sulphureus 93-53]KZT03563.1 glycoside hydrolase family 13 protein [Laetiporus sulphureus 93-53]
MRAILHALSFLSLCTSVFAATAEQWRSRSIYQIITDRYALSKGANRDACDPGDQTWCGGTWNTTRENLDYIQNAGFTAVWISPVSQNYEGPRTSYGDAYHGYWIADVTELNNRFGTSDDLKALSAELHRRGMYLMVDVVVNNVMGTSIMPDLSTYYFKEQSQYHPYCPIQWGNTTSEQDCWLGDKVVTLPDLNTQDPTVVSGYTAWIKALVSEYEIDGLRIDGELSSSHVNMDFWPKFSSAAGVFCIGEVFDSDVAQAAQWQGTDALDSILNYPMYGALVDAFGIPGSLNTSALTDMVTQSQKTFKDTGLLGNFLEDQDVPRWSNFSTDPQSKYNAMVFNFMSDGIPIVYYGQEQAFHGSGDPWNREPLWPSNYTNTTTYQLMSTLNKFRNFLINGTTGWLNSSMEILTTSPYGIGMMKGDVVSILTNIGSPPQNVSIAVYTPYKEETSLTDILSCEQYAVGSNGTVVVSYTEGGHATILLPDRLMNGSDLCGYYPGRIDWLGETVSTQAASGAQFVSGSASIFILSVLLGICTILVMS